MDLVLNNIKTLITIKFKKKELYENRNNAWKYWIIAFN